MLFTRRVLRGASVPDFSAFLGQGTHALMLPVWLELTAVVVGSLSGSLVAIDRKLDMTGCVTLSLICGVGGGLLRDVCLGDVPRIFQTSNLYALCALGGSLTYFALYDLAHVMNPWLAIACTLVTVALRRASLRWGIVSSTSRDHTDMVLAPVRRAAERARGHAKRHGE